MQRTNKLLAQCVDKSTDLYLAICKDACEHLNVNQVSLWQFDEAVTQVTCLCSYFVDDSSVKSGAVIKSDQCPSYFKAVSENPMIKASDVRTYPDTSELTQDYYIPNNVFSLFDSVIRTENKPRILMSCESRGYARDWGDEDESYITDLTKLIKPHLT